MAWFYNVDGAVRFPNSDGPEKWRRTAVRSWKGKGKVTVAQVLEWTTKEGLVDPSAPSEFRATFYLDVITDGPATTFRGFIHRDEADSIGALLDEAAELGAKGKVLLDHVLDSDSGVRFELTNGKCSVRVGDVKMSRRVIQEIEHESEARARKAKKPASKAKAKAKPKAKAKAKPKHS